VKKPNSSQRPQNENTKNKHKPHVHTYVYGSNICKIFLRSANISVIVLLVAVLTSAGDLERKQLISVTPHPIASENATAERERGEECVFSE